MAFRLVGAAVAWVLLLAQAQAHEVRPGYLEIQETQAHSYDVRWKVPARGNLRLGIYPLLPDNCDAETRVITRQVGGSYVDSWSMSCTGGLQGGQIRIDGLSSTLTDTLLRITLLDGTAHVSRLTSTASSFVVPESPTRTRVAATYAGLGIEHILLGIDHLLFVLALLLLVRGWRQVVVTITAFTLAHSITLGAATLGLVTVPQRPVEAVIALSIVLVAAEILNQQRGRSGLARRWPFAVAFVFGLLHGFGFAGALNELGLPQQAIPLALLFFNVGVELGQIAFIAGAFMVWSAIRRIRFSLPSWVACTPAYLIGSIASFWTIERIVGF